MTIPEYKDTEFCVYHYPQQYIDLIRGGERFVYYRPSGDAKPTSSFRMRSIQRAMQSCGVT